MSQYVYTLNPDGSYRAATPAGRVLGTLERVRVSNRVPAEVRWQAVDRDGRRVGTPQMSRDRAAWLLERSHDPRHDLPPDRAGQGRNEMKPPQFEGHIQTIIVTANSIDPIPLFGPDRPPLAAPHPYSAQIFEVGNPLGVTGTGQTPALAVADAYRRLQASGPPE